MLALALASSIAHAALVEAWASDFPRNGELAGEDGWVNGYDGDAWYGTESEGDRWAYSLADHYSDGRFGDGGPHDNWLVNAATPVKQGTYALTVYPTDNDAFGVVFGSSDERYFMLLVCGEEDNDSSIQSCPVGGLDTHVTALVEVRGDDATVIDSVELGARTYSETDVEVAMDNGTVVVRFGRTEFSMPVESDFQLDGVGFYAFNEGLYDEEGENDGDTVYFRDLTLSWLDEDGDDVVDDDDNCESVANRDQADADGDGAGAACDEDDAVDPGGDDTDDGGDTDGGGDTDDTDSRAPIDDGVVVVGDGCGCDGAAAAPTFVAGLLGALGLAARRRRRTG